jgi:hypothetical protein
MWNGKQWVARKQGNIRIGRGSASGATPSDAMMYDRPIEDDPIRATRDTSIFRAETAVFAIDTHEVLGVIHWGFRKSPGAPIELIGPEITDITPAAMIII